MYTFVYYVGHVMTIKFIMARFLHHHHLDYCLMYDRLMTFWYSFVTHYFKKGVNYLILYNCHLSDPPFLSHELNSYYFLSISSTSSNLSCQLLVSGKKRRSILDSEFPTILVHNLSMWLVVSLPVLISARVSMQHFLSLAKFPAEFNSFCGRFDQRMFAIMLFRYTYFLFG